MESIDSSPNHVTSISRSDEKKENSPQGGSECDDNISIISSTGKSAIKGLKKNTGIRYRNNNKKMLKTFGSVKSFRRRAKTRLIQSPAEIESDDTAGSHFGSVVDSSASSPHYLKATSSSQGKKMRPRLSPRHSESLIDGNSSPFSQSKSGSPDKKPLVSRSSSIRNVRFLVKKTSFKPRRAALNYSEVSEDVSVDRATYSSTVKDSKFPEQVVIHLGGTEPEKLSAMKVCRYHHCSLHGHCRGAHDPAPQPKRMPYRRRWSLKKQRSMKLKSDPSLGTKQSGDRKKELQKSRVSAAVESSNEESVSNKIAVDSPAVIYSKQEAAPFGDGYDSSLGLDLIEIAFGETSFPERSYQDNLSILRKYSFKENDFGGTSFGPNVPCLRCSCHNQGQGTINTHRRVDADLSLFKSTSSVSSNGYGDDIPQNGYADVAGTSSSVDKAKQLGHNNHAEDDAIPSCSNTASNDDRPATPVSVEVTADNSVFHSPLDSQTSTHINSDEEGDIKTESTPDGDSKVDEAMQDSATYSPAHNGSKLQFSKQRHISMWHLIHQHMSSNISAESPEKPLQVAGVENLAEDDRIPVAKEISASDRNLSDSRVGMVNTEPENQEIEIRKLFAIKLVREAIEKILLPEVQDQASDDQSLTSESTPRTEIEKNENQVFKQASYGDNDASSNTTEGTHTRDDASGLETKETHDGPEIKKTEKKALSKSENKAPKHWSNLKKWILLQRFISALEKVRKFNPRKPQHLPLNPDPEAEKVNLRPQTVDERKNAEEWMLDYALRQAVGQLAPTQKKKVALLVKAFETVVPPQEGVHSRITQLKGNLVDTSSSGYEVNQSLSEDTGSETEKPSSTAQISVLDNDETLGALESPEKIVANVTEREATPKLLGLQEAAAADCIHGNVKDGGQHNVQVDRKNHIKMWHMIYQHVVSGIAEKIGSRLLDEAEEDDREETKPPAKTNSGFSNDSPKSRDESNNLSSGFTKGDALKLIKDAVDEILLPDIQDDSSDTQSVTSESIADADISERNSGEIEEQNTSTEDQIVMSEEGNRSRHGMTSVEEDIKAESLVKRKLDLSKSKNWNKVKKLMLLKRSIKALEKARTIKTQTHQLLPQMPDPEPEKIELRQQMMDERKKAEQWMLDYAVQHIVTKLTPARKRRVSMLVEAFEAVVPFPDA